MAVTIKKIAELCGVSRGTVDRVLNNRGKVKPETEALIRRVAEQLDYKPNIAGKALAARKKSFVIGVIVASEGNPFFDDVLKGIHQAENELHDYGVKIIIKTMKGYDIQRQLKLIEELEGGIHALILNSISDAEIAAKIDELTDKGIPVITLNTDIENSKRLCYVGCDYVKGGETACGMLGLLTGGRAKVGVITGSVKILGHNQRVQGFRNVIKRRYPGIEVVDFAESNDDDIIAFEATKKMLLEHKEIDALFIAAAGAYGVCRAVISLGLENKITIVCFDDVPSTVEMMEKGLIKATICQQPFLQGNKSVHIAYDYLVSGARPHNDQFIVENKIKILENLYQTP
ncbi:LacI family transcriptional regulator [Clostridium thermosuccinogenes]|uniref:LacI family transcriptional regulator n=1 Tax=Clostridium thermosuccinogenes TaxID=84032 RepID=A0A2K2FJL1_9CLOT|nr:LacI family DNA-binding transcriptional regulator [Pseudoclostridium thermosuccinogenes]AUS98355.1 LacI family transcriptional regulator [Pseudoclostridium thermosuccinogenes]PNT98965.1 LacI family transcriptional regulator [Pseudoclostridium thermosuccinogenes]PNU00880.1 LacI family transcriptional regulator [Pseudoclostridium thermosuccinogenes]